MISQKVIQDDEDVIDSDVSIESNKFNGEEHLYQEIIVTHEESHLLLNELFNDD